MNLLNQRVRNINKLTPTSKLVRPVSKIVLEQQFAERVSFNCTRNKIRNVS